MITENCGEKTSSWGRFHNRSRESRGFDIDAKVQVSCPKSVLRCRG